MRVLEPCFPGLDGGEQVSEIEAMALRRKGPEPSPALGQHPTGNVGSFSLEEVKHADADLDQPLEQVFRLGGRGAPDLLPGLVAGEELTTVEQADAFLEELAALTRVEVGMQDPGQGIPSRLRFCHRALRLMPSNSAARPWWPRV